ncbi:MAG: hypothetical protein OXC93_08000, partial [Rhodospirillaceae bacterium]|nr:hypothetical protein [Rhodospirillaceae bacterium]
TPATLREALRQADLETPVPDRAMLRHDQASLRAAPAETDGEPHTIARLLHQEAAQAQPDTFVTRHWSSMTVPYQVTMQNGRSMPVTFCWSISTVRTAHIFAKRTS